MNDQADFSQARTRSEELRAQLEYHSYRYYVVGEPEISDVHVAVHFFETTAAENPSRVAAGS